jgi:hypothetical protein
MVGRITTGSVGRKSGALPPLRKLGDTRGMPDYRRGRVPGGTFFFTVNLRDPRSDLLVTQIDYCATRFVGCAPARPSCSCEPPPSCRRGVNPFELSAPAVGGFDGDEGASRLRRSWLSRRSPLEARVLKTPRR